jgi:hypothetical protein
MDVNVDSGNERRCGAINPNIPYWVFLSSNIQSVSLSYDSWLMTLCTFRLLLKIIKFHNLSLL